MSDARNTQTGAEAMNINHYNLREYPKMMLQSLARQLGITGRSRMTKAELIEAIDGNLRWQWAKSKAGN